MTTETPTEPLPLTDRQREVLDFIRANMHLYSPTVREIAAAMSIKSPNGVFVHLEALERKGYIRMANGKARGIEVVHAD
jgi:SOS-response transcriptional repressor LexA